MGPDVKEGRVVQMHRVRCGSPATTAAAERGSRRGRGTDARDVVLRQTIAAAKDVSASSDSDRGRRGPRGVGRFPRVGLLSLRTRRGVVDAVAAVELCLVLLLPLHPPVLEPDLDLSLCEAKSVGDLDPSPPREIPVEVELLLKLQGLVTGVRLASTLSF